MRKYILHASLTPPRDASDAPDRLRQLEQLLAPRVVAPRPPADDAMLPPLLVVERHLGRMYVAGHEPHFRPVTLLAPARPTQAGLDAI